MDQQSLHFAGARTFQQLRNSTTEQLQLASSLVAGNAAPYGTFHFGPVIDGDCIPDLPGVLLAQGKYNKGVDLMTITAVMKVYCLQPHS